jgi:hypothetical protein
MPWGELEYGYLFEANRQPVLGKGPMAQLFPRLIELFDGKSSQEYQSQWGALEEEEKVEVCDSLKKAYSEQLFELDVEFYCKDLEHYGKVRKEASMRLDRCAKEYEALMVLQSTDAATDGDKFVLKHTLTLKVIETLRRKKEQAERHIKGFTSLSGNTHPVNTVEEFQKLIKELQAAIGESQRIWAENATGDDGGSESEAILRWFDYL